jgi:hypothetical protein
MHPLSERAVLGASAESKARLATSSSPTRCGSADGGRSSGLQTGSQWGDVIATPNMKLRLGFSPSSKSKKLFAKGPTLLPKLHGAGTPQLFVQLLP